MAAIEFALTERQHKGLLKLGDATIPGDRRMPSFSNAGVAHGIDRMLPYMHDADRDSLLMLLDACAVLPRPAVRAVVALATKADKAPEPLAGALRMANIGIKGVVCSLYYSDLAEGLRAGEIHKAIGWDPMLVERPDANTGGPFETPRASAPQEPTLAGTRSSTNVTTVVEETEGRGRLETTTESEETR